MKVSHTDLEAMRTNLGAWVASKQSGGGFKRGGYNQVVRLAIYSFHKTNDPVLSQQHLVRLLDRYGLSNESRRADAQTQLLEYMDWSESSGLIVVERKARIFLELGQGASLGGEIGRVDLDPNTGNYRGVLIGNVDHGWQQQLRMPLLQRAISIRILRDESDVSIGVQELSGESMQVVSFSKEEIEEAQEEAFLLVTRASIALAQGV